MEMNNENFAEFRKDFKDAVEYLERKWAIDISIGNISYSQSSFTTKMQVINGLKEDFDRQEFEKYATRYGLKPTDFHREVKDTNGNDVKIIGISPKSRKYPIIVERLSDNKKYKYMLNYLVL